MFQFQYGSIKSAVKLIDWYLNPQFQFQYGSIKREYEIKKKPLKVGFNSSMVRLKGALMV